MKIAIVYIWDQRIYDRIIKNAKVINHGISSEPTMPLARTELETERDAYQWFVAFEQESRIKQVNIWK